MATPTGFDAAVTRPVVRLPSAGRGLVVAGLVLLGIIGTVALLAPWLSAWGPTEIDPGSALQPPSDVHPLGTDRNGMDIWSRVAHAARIDLGIAVSAVAVAVVVGSALGAVIGYVGGWIDEIAMRVTDMFQAFPPFILALAVASMFGPRLTTLVVVIALVNTPAYLRLMRSEVRAAREHAYVEAARAAGNGTFAILFRHIVPNSLLQPLVIAPLNCGWAMLTLAGLSFLGLGVQVPTAEWGAMISTGAADMVAGRYWTSVFPGLALFTSVLGFTFLGEGLLERTRVGRD